MNDAAAAAEPDDLHGMLLRAPARIGALLHRLRLHHSLLSVRAGGSQRWHASIVIAVDGTQRTLDLDALHPAPPHEPTAGSQLTVRGRVDGGDLRFRCRVLGASVAENAAALRVAFPDEIFVLERRAAFRLNLPEQFNLAPSHVGREWLEHPARLVDVSHAGAGAVVPNSVEPALGDTLKVRIQLPGTVIDTEAEVRSVTPGATGIRIGLQLGALRSEDETRLAQAINGLERQMIRAARARW